MTSSIHKLENKIVHVKRVWILLVITNINKFSIRFEYIIKLLLSPKPVLKKKSFVSSSISEVNESVLALHNLYINIVLYECAFIVFNKIYRSKASSIQETQITRAFVQWVYCNNTFIKIATFVIENISIGYDIR